MKRPTKFALAAVIVAGGLFLVVPNRPILPQQKPIAFKCMTNARQIGMACRLYAADHGGAFPQRLDDLVPDYLAERTLLSSPLAPQPGAIDYSYFGAGQKDTDPAANILLSDTYTTKQGQRSVVQFDFSVRLENR